MGGPMTGSMTRLVAGDGALGAIHHGVRGKSTADAVAVQRFADAPAPARLMPDHGAAEHGVVG
jgi:hypothetical protein